ncbi:MAG: hypothetical protein ACTSWV_04280, partial [Candidatus Asgardarchaeia archaeon]
MLWMSEGWNEAPDCRGMRLQKAALGYTSTVGAALTKPELGRMKPKLTNLESPDFSRGECQ